MSVAEIVRPVSPASQQRLELGISPTFCRNLFGPIDHEQLRAELESEMRRIADEKKRRWNFDFVKFEPQDGQFVWQRIGDNRTVAFTTTESSSHDHSNDLRAAVPVPNTTASSNEIPVDSDSNSNARNVTSNATKTCFKTPERATTKRSRKSPKITDFFRGKKSSTSRKIKFTGQAGDSDTCRRVQTRKSSNRGQSGKQLPLDAGVPKLRPRQSRGKVQVSI